ncbi:MAG: MFS transporter [Thermomicrobiales bacterium]
MQSYFRGVRGYGRDIKLFLLYNLLSNVGIGVFQLLFNLYLIQLGYDEAFIGQFQSISTLSMAGVALSIGVLVNRFGVWRTVMAGLVFFLVTSVLASIITNQFALLVMAGLSGAGTAFLFVPTMPFIVELTGRHERHGVAALAFSLNSLSMTVGSLIGGFGARGIGGIFGLEVPSAEAYRYTLIAGLVLAGFAVLPLMAMSNERKRALPEDEQASGLPATGAVAQAPRTIRRHMMVFIAIGGLMSLGAGAVFPFYNVFLESRGASSGQIGIIYAAAGLSAAFVGLFSPWVAHRLGSLKATAIVRLAPVPIYILLMATPALPVAILAHIVRTTSINMAWPIDSTYISDVLPARARASVFSFRSGAWNLGWSFSSLIAGYAIVRYGYNVSFAAYIIFMSLAMGLFYIYFSRSASQEQLPAAQAGEPASATE